MLTTDKHLVRIEQSVVEEYSPNVSMARLEAPCSSAQKPPVTSCSP